MSTATASETLAAIAADVWQQTLENCPELASMLGDSRYDDRLSDESEAGRESSLARAKATLERLAALDDSALSGDEKITKDIIRIGAEASVEGSSHNFHYWSIDQLNGPQVSFATMVQNFHPKKTADDWRNLVSRYRAFETQMKDYVDALSRGQEAGYSAPKIAVERVHGQLEDLLGGAAEDSVFYKLADQIPEDIADREAIAAELKAAAIEKVLPALDSMRRYLAETALPKAREEAGMWANPGGDEAYRYLVKRHLGKALDAQEVHDLGLSELASIEAEMEAIAQSEGLDRKSYAAKLLADPSNFHSDKDALVAEYSALIDKATARLPELFTELTEIPCVVRPVEEYREKDAPTGFYNPPAVDGSRPGIFYANCYKPETRLRSNMAVLTYHEAVPGHHLQISRALELELPEVRRHGHFTAYIEGWALYTERLCDELGLYETPQERFGMLGFQAWRAARLVIDTALHSLRWTRQQALDFLKEHTVLPESEVINEIDRYLIMPGQALSYKIGEIAIQGLRKEAQAALGEAFDIRGFHDTLIGSGALPLETLERLVRDWIQSQKK